MKYIGVIPTMSIYNKNLWSQKYILLIIANLFLFFGFYLVPPVILLHVQIIGGSSIEISLVVGAFAFTSLLFRMFGGNISDVFSEKIVAIAGLFLMAIATYSYIFLMPKAIIIMRLLHGTGLGLATASLATAVSYIVPKNLVGQGIGYYSLTAILSTSFSPIVSLLLFNRIEFGGVAIFSIILYAVSAIVILFIPKRPIEKKQSLVLKPNEFIEKNALFPSLLEFLMILPALGITAMLSIYAHNISYQHIWVYYIGFSFMVLLTRPFIGKIFDKRGHKEIILLGSACMIAGFVILSFARTTIPLVFSSIFYGLGYGAVHPSLQAWAVSSAQDDRKGAANGTFLSSMDLGYLIGGFVLGAIVSSQGYAKMYLYSPIFIIILMLLYLFYLLKKPSFILSKKENPPL